MSQQESYILFLRKAEQPTEAYYTLEVEPDGTIGRHVLFITSRMKILSLQGIFL